MRTKVDVVKDTVAAQPQWSDIKDGDYFLADGLGKGVQLYRRVVLNLDKTGTTVGYVRVDDDWRYTKTYWNGREPALKLIKIVRKLKIEVVE